MTRPQDVRRGHPLPLVVPTAFVRIRPVGLRSCGMSATLSTRRCRAASRRFARQ
jgi:hypothetical protein